MHTTRVTLGAVDITLVLERLHVAVDRAMRIDADRAADFLEFRRVPVLCQVVADELQCLLFLGSQHRAKPSRFILSECREKNENMQPGASDAAHFGTAVASRRS